MTTDNTPRIYCACLASYNNGDLHGDWIDLTNDTTAEEIQERIDAILKASPAPDAEEWAFHDHENIPAYSEFMPVTDLEKIAEAFEDVADDWMAYLQACSCDGEILDPDDFRDYLAGYADSGAEYAEQLAEDLDQIPTGWPGCHIDWDAAWRDLECDGYWLGDWIDNVGRPIFRQY